MRKPKAAGPGMQRSGNVRTTMRPVFRGKGRKGSGSGRMKGRC